uniref:G-protein coupled receptors family 3 profile domain-containing protein n=1 Tax=Lepisosteus oculatus TaxID=7918 RepID=W5M349_LEPOC
FLVTSVSKSVLVALYLFTLLQYVCAEWTCRILGNFGMPALFKNGDVIIGGIFPVFNKQEHIYTPFQTEPPKASCVGFDLRAFRWTQGMIFALEEINSDYSLLPNITLGYQIVDSCASPTQTLRAAFTLINVIAESGSSQSIAIARTIGPFTMPLVSYFSTCSCLSNKKEFPTFFRTIPSDFYQAKALALLVKRFGWSWIGAIESENDYGRFGVQSFTEEVQKYGVCIAFTETILRTYPRHKILKVVDTIKESTAKIILAFVPEGDLYPLMQEITRQNITGIQWIASEAWVTAARPSTEEIFKSFGGTIGFATRKMAIPKFKEFLLNIHPSVYPGSSFVKEFWENIFGCSLLLKEEPPKHNGTQGSTKTCTGKERLDAIENAFFDVSQLRVTYNVYKAVYAVAHALHDLLFCEKGENSTIKLCGDIAGLKHWQVHTFSFFTSTTCQICNSFIGAAECINCPKHYWSNDGKNSCILRDIEFLSYYDAMGITLTTVSLFGLCLTVATISVFFSFRSTPIVKANNSELSSLLLFSLLLCFLCPLTFIGQPTAWSCMLRHTAFGITFALCISCVLGKTIVVVTAFRATLPNDNMAKNFGPVQQRIIVCSCTAVQVVICVLWLSLKPPFPDKNFKLSNKKIILECNTGSEIAFYAVLGYIGLLAATCLVLAFLARKLPDNFNEAKLITFSMLIFCAVWVTFIPAYVSSPGKYTVAVEIFAILSSTFGLLFCICAPKCYIVLLKPEKNTRKHIMGKLPSKRL